MGRPEKDGINGPTHRETVDSDGSDRNKGKGGRGRERES